MGGWPDLIPLLIGFSLIAQVLILVFAGWMFRSLTRALVRASQIQAIHQLAHQDPATYRAVGTAIRTLGDLNFDPPPSEPETPPESWDDSGALRISSRL